MKVKGPGGPKATEKSKKKDSGAQIDSASFGSMLVSTASEAEENAAVRSISKVDSLIAAQAVEDPTEKEAQKRMRDRAGSILDALDRIKIALLNGNLRFSHLENITHMIAVNRERINDPELAYLLDEIDLRAQVELAKLEAAKESALKQMNMM
tara:strand:+ start:84 stop:542 length:459 start_codon:yes stop_codon:yes gene_type:complete